MPRVALFAGLVEDETGQPVEVTYVGGEPCYVVNNAGFHRHIPSEDVDRQVLKSMQEQVEGHEDILSDQVAKMLGQEDIFTRAIIQNQLKNMDQQFTALLNTGIPEETRMYLGMAGFRVIINFHGEVVDVHQPGRTSGEDEGDSE
jgi:hypothetical protein